MELPMNITSCLAYIPKHVQPYQTGKALQYCPEEHSSQHDLYHSQDPVQHQTS